MRKTSRFVLSSDYLPPQMDRVLGKTGADKDKTRRLAQVLAEEAGGEPIHLEDGVFGSAKELAEALKQLGLRVEHNKDGSFTARKWP